MHPGLAPHQASGSAAAHLCPRQHPTGCRKGQREDTHAGTPHISCRCAFACLLLTVLLADTQNAAPLQIPPNNNSSTATHLRKSALSSPGSRTTIHTMSTSSRAPRSWCSASSRRDTSRTCTGHSPPAGQHLGSAAASLCAVQGVAWPSRPSSSAALVYVHHETHCRRKMRCCAAQSAAHLRQGGGCRVLEKPGCVDAGQRVLRAELVRGRCRLLLAPRRRHHQPPARAARRWGCCAQAGGGKAQQRLLVGALSRVQHSAPGCGASAPAQLLIHHAARLPKRVQQPLRLRAGVTGGSSAAAQGGPPRRPAAPGPAAGGGWAGAGCAQAPAGLNRWPCCWEPRPREERHGAGGLCSRGASLIARALAAERRVSVEGGWVQLLGGALKVQRQCWDPTC